MNPYFTLGVELKATDKEIKVAYRKLAKVHHPDHGGNAKNFAEINLAYQVLMDPERRKDFDDHGIIKREQINDARHQAFDMLATYYDNAIKSGAAFDQNVSLLIIIRTAAKKDQEQALANITAKDRMMTKLNGLLKKFTRKDDGDDNVFRSMTETHIRDCREAINANKRVVQATSILLKELECYQTVEQVARNFYSVRFYRSNSINPNTTC